MILIDRTNGLVEKGIKLLSEEMDKKIRKWGLTGAESEAILSGVRASLDASHAARADLVIEATPEDLELERSLSAKKEISAIEKRVYLRRGAARRNILSPTGGPLHERPAQSRRVTRRCSESSPVHVSIRGGD